jgi:hypothetical protein
VANACLFIGWNRPHPGRDEDAWKFLMGEGSDALRKFQEQGYFETIETIALTAHMSDLNGFLLLFGTRAKLDELRRTDAFEAFSMKMGSLMDRYGVVPGLNREGIDAVMKRMPSDRR